MSERKAVDYNTVSPNKNPKDFIIEALQSEAAKDTNELGELRSRVAAAESLIELLLRSRATDKLSTAEEQERDREEIEAAKNAAITDFLTNVKNRLGLNTEVYAKRISLEHKDPERKSDGVVLMVDADKFKTLNDTHGHATGDLALKFLADKLTSLFGHDDVVARFGGEEFVVYCPNGDVDTIYEKLSGSAEESARIPVSFTTPEGTTINFTVSGGITELKSNEDFNVALGRVDAALYDAKSKGRNKILKA